MTQFSRTQDIETATEPLEPSDEPLIIFARSGLQAHWEPLCGTLLGFARALGLDPNSSCSQGMCGCCATKILEGAVDYIDEPLHGEPEGKALLCYTVPSKALKGDILRLDI